jgi:hypothetical protein
MICNELDYHGIWVRFPTRKIPLSSASRKDMGHTTSYSPMATGGYFHVFKRPRREAEHSSPP